MDALRGRRRVVVLTHDNPDPDGIGSAVALRHLVHRYAGVTATIAHGGIAGRSENRAMLRFLRVKPVPSAHLAWRRFDLVCLVDAQPTAGNVTLPEDVVPGVVFDHHPPRGPVPGTALWDVEEGAGATCTLLAELYLRNGIPLPQPIATGLALGIKAETQDLGRETSPRDEEVYTALYALANKRLLSRIESERVPRTYFGEFARAIDGARVHDAVVVSDLGDVAAPDIVPEMADFLLRLEGMRWSCVLGCHEDLLHVSVRAADATLQAAALLRRAMHGMGSCGGHGSMAGGQIPLLGMTPGERRQVREVFVADLLPRLHVRDRAGTPLL